MRTAGLLAGALLLAGCLGQPAPPAAPAPGPPAGEVQVGDRPEPTFGNVTTGPTAPPDEAATLAAAPRLRAGEWWRIRFFTPVTGERVEFVRVVAAIQEGNYVLGMPHEGWYKETMLVHTPAFGDVRAEDLSHDTHDVPFQPLRFPLTEDQTWETSFSGSLPLRAKVVPESERVARVEFSIVDPPPTAPPPPQLVLVYDATLHEVREFRYATVQYEVVEHGYGFEGWVTVPRGEDLIFFHGRVAGAHTLGYPLTSPRPAAPSETVDIAGGYNRVTFAHIMGSVPPPRAPPPPGAYRERTVAPDGTEFLSEAIPATGIVVRTFEFPNPDGTWQFEHVAAGPGFSFTEGIAYHQYDIHVPSGAKRADHAHKVIR